MCFEVIPIKKLSGKKQILLAFVLVIACFLFAVRALTSIPIVLFRGEAVVCLDPGHGGKSLGALSQDKKRKEQDDNLALALRVKTALEARNVTVVMTRETDVDVSLQQRCRIANLNRADLFVSLHRNSGDNGTGMEVWICDKPSKKEEKLAGDILKGLVKASDLPMRGVKKGYRNSSGTNYYVNANTNMPSCLVEVGFITSAADNRNFDRNLNAYAESIADAICKNLP